MNKRVLFVLAALAGFSRALLADVAAPPPDTADPKRLDRGIIVAAFAIVTFGAVMLWRRLNRTTAEKP